MKSINAMIRSSVGMSPHDKARLGYATYAAFKNFGPAF
jgi:hypothetical protein